MLLQSDLNKRRISQLAKLDELYINSASTRLLQISKNSFIEYKKQIFPNDSYIHLKACDAASSYHRPSPIFGYNITCRCKTCIIAKLLQSYLNKWRISQVEKLDKLYINSASTQLLQISNNYFI